MFSAGFLKRCCPILLLLALAAHAVAKNPRGEKRPRTVSLYVTVEKDGGLVSGLTERNFRVYEDGEARPFRLAQPEQPMTIALLVEYSRSSWMYFSDIVSAMRGFVNEAPDGNWYALATFSNTLKVEVDFTKQKGNIPAAFADLGTPFWDSVNTYDAVCEMLDKMDRLTGRRVLIFIGSGLDNFSSYSLRDVERLLERVNVIVYGVGAGSLLRGQYEPFLSTPARMNMLQAEAFLRMLADKTGGEAWFPRFDSAFPSVMRGIMQTLAHQYHLAYESVALRDGKFHEVRVEAFRVVDDRREDFKVRARQGWRF